MALYSSKISSPFPNSSLTPPKKLNFSYREQNTLKNIEPGLPGGCLDVTRRREGREAHRPGLAVPQAEGGRRLQATLLSSGAGQLGAGGGGEGGGEAGGLENNQERQSQRGHRLQEFQSGL